VTISGDLCCQHWTVSRQHAHRPRPQLYIWGPAGLPRLLALAEHCSRGDI